MDNNWHYLATGYGLLFLTEMIGFVLIPSFMYAVGVRDKKYSLIRFASFLTVAGVILNRIDVSLVAFNYNLPAESRYFPSWEEFVISAFVVTLIVTAYRFICTQMPVLFQHPEYDDAH